VDAAGDLLQLLHGTRQAIRYPGQLRPQFGQLGGDKRLRLPLVKRE
jgi:hypothetical protein